MTNNLKFMIFNAQSVRNKKTEIFEFLATNSIDIALFSETHLTNTDSFSHVDFHTYRLDRDSNRKGGGVAILVRRQISHKLLSCPNTKVIEAISIQLYVRNHVLNIFSVYFPPSRDSTDLLHFKQDLEVFTRGSNFLIGGDLNARHSAWNCT